MSISNPFSIPVCSARGLALARLDNPSDDEQLNDLARVVALHPEEDEAAEDSTSLLFDFSNVELNGQNRLTLDIKILSSQTREDCWFKNEALAAKVIF